MSEKDLDLGDLETRVQNIINDTDSTVLTYIAKWIQDRNYDVNSRFEWPYLQAERVAELTFGPGMYECDLPEDFKVETKVYDNEVNVLIKKSTLKEVMENDPDYSEDCTVAGSTINYYYPSPGVIAIWPKVAATETTDLVLKMDYLADDPPLANTSDKPTMPNRFRVATLVYGAVADYYYWKDDTRASLYEGKYESGVARMVKEQGIFEDIGDEDLRRKWGD